MAGGQKHSRETAAFPGSRGGLSTAARIDSTAESAQSHSQKAAARFSSLDWLARTKQTNRDYWDQKTKIVETRGIALFRGGFLPTSYFRYSFALSLTG